MQSTLSPLSAPWSTKTWPGIGTVIIGKGAKPWGGGGGGPLHILLDMSIWTKSFCLIFLGNYMDFVGKNKTVNITKKKKGKERIAEEVVTGSVREIFGKNEGDRSRNWLNEERKKFCFWIQWVFSTEFQPFFLFYANFFAVLIISSGIQCFFTLGQDYHLWKFARSFQELIIIELCRIDLLFH